MTKKSKKYSVSYEEGLIQRLKDPEYAAAYLNAILSDKGKDLQARVLGALQSIAKAYGMTEVSKRTKLQRETLRKALSEKGNPTVFTLFALLKTFGIQLRAEASVATVVKQTKEQDLSQKIDQIQIAIGHLQRGNQEIQPIFIVETKDDTTVSQSPVSPYKSVSETATTVSIGVRGAKHVH